MNQRAQSILTIIGLFIISCNISPIAGLKCYSCIHMIGGFENPECKIGAVSRNDLKICDSTTVLNGREMQAVKVFSPEAEFKFICMKTRMNAGELDLVIRGCFAQDLKKTSAWTQGSACQSPRDDQKFWREFTNEKLSNQKSSVNRKDIILDVCGCYDRDGCNSASAFELSILTKVLMFGAGFISLLMNFK